MGYRQTEDASKRLEEDGASKRLTEEGLATESNVALPGRWGSTTGPGLQDPLAIEILGPTFRDRGDKNPVAATVTGTLATTNANDTLAASGGYGPSGSLAKTNANDTLSGAGSTVTGTSSTTNNNDTLSASGTGNGTVAETQQVGGGNREMDRQLRELLIREDEEFLLLI